MQRNLVLTTFLSLVASCTNPSAQDVCALEQRGLTRERERIAVHGIMIPGPGGYGSELIVSDCLAGSSIPVVGETPRNLAIKKGAAIDESVRAKKPVFVEGDFAVLVQPTKNVPAGLGERERIVVEIVRRRGQIRGGLDAYLG